MPACCAFLILKLCSCNRLYAELHDAWNVPQHDYQTYKSTGSSACLHHCFNTEHAPRPHVQNRYFKKSAHVYAVSIPPRMVPTTPAMHCILSVQMPIVAYSRLSHHQCSRPQGEAESAKASLTQAGVWSHRCASDVVGTVLAANTSGLSFMLAN